MSTPIFRVDLSPGAQDYESTATEPGLPMLDAQRVNYGLLRTWFGDAIAEPHWENNSVAFYARNGERGRLERAKCVPITRSDLEGVLAEDVQKLKNRLRKIKPESATEQLLLRIAKEKLKVLLGDAEGADYDSFLFKVRQGKEDWRLLWAWGYQRADQQPAASEICRLEECKHLYVKRPKQKAACPICAVAGRRYRSLLSRVATPLVALLLLLLLVAFLLPPQVTPVPAQWSGSAGSRIDFRVTQTRLFLFTSDVTDFVIAQSQDSRILEFERGSQAKAKNEGTTIATFIYNGRVAMVPINVTPLTPPDSLSIVPQSIEVAVGATVPLKAEGSYSDGNVVDVTDMVQWTADDSNLASFGGGRAEGMAAGTTTIHATFPGTDGDNVTAQAQLTVTEAQFASLVAEVVPQAFGIGQSARVDVWGVDADGNRHDLSGSSGLTLTMEPADFARLENGYLIGEKEGSSELTAKFGDLQTIFAFQVELNPGAFAVSPETLELMVDEYYTLEVINGSGEPVEIVSSDPSIVEPLGDTSIAGRAPGTATVTVSSGSNQATVQVTVGESAIESIYFNPRLLALDVGDVVSIPVYANTKAGTTIEVAPDRLVWIKQPVSEVASIDRETMEIVGLQPSEAVHDIQVRYGSTERLMAMASVQVSGEVDPLAALDFLAHPPIGMGRKVVAGPLVGEGLIYEGDRVVVGDVGPFSALGAVPSGSVITAVGDRDLTGLTGVELEQYFAANPIGKGAVIQYRTPGGVDGALVLDPDLEVVQDVKVVQNVPSDIQPESFVANLDVFVRQDGDYRVTNEAGDSLTEFETHPGGTVVSFTTTPIPRNGSDDYELFIEQRTDVVKRFQVPFKLKLQGQP